MQQRDPEWYQTRLGKVTASRIADVCARTKTGWGASRANYKAQLVCERLTGEPTESFESAAMVWGRETEPQAKAAYEFLTDTPVTEIAFVNHPRIDMAGCSPDGLAGDDGLVEIKCPNTASHLDTLVTEKVPGAYRKQMLFQMACTDRQWCDFVSFDPRLPEPMQLWVTRIERDDAEVAELEEIVAEFLAEVDQTVATLRDRYMKEQAA